MTLVGIVIGLVLGVPFGLLLGGLLEANGEDSVTTGLQEGLDVSPAGYR